MKKIYQKWYQALSIILALTLTLSLVACGSSEDSASNPDDAPIAQEQTSTYFQCLKMYQDKIDELTAGDPIDTDALWNVYTALAAIQVREYIFKSKLYSETYPGKTEEYTDGEGAAIKNAVWEIEDKMNAYFPEDAVAEFSNNLSLDTLAMWDVMEVDFYKVTNRSDEVDLDASWENYFANNIDPEIFAGTHMAEKPEIVLSLPDGTQLVNEGTSTLECGFFSVQYRVEEPGYYIDAYSWNEDVSSAFAEELYSDGYATYGWRYQDTVHWGSNWIGSIRQTLVEKDGQLSVIGSLCMAMDEYGCQITFRANDMETNYEQSLSILNSITVDGIGLTETIDTPDFSSLVDEIREFNTTAIEQYQKLLYTNIEDLTSGKSPYEGVFTGTFRNEEYDIQLELCAYRDMTISSEDAEESLTYSLNYTSGDFRLECIPSSWSGCYESDSHRVIFYPGYNESIFGQIMIECSSDGVYTLYSSVSNEEDGFHQETLDNNELVRISE